LSLPLFHPHNVGFNVVYEQLLARAVGRGLDRLISGDCAAGPFDLGEGRGSAFSWLLPLRRLLGAMPKGIVPALHKLILYREGLPIGMPEMPPSVSLATSMIDSGARSRLMAAARDACAFIPDEHDRMVKALILADIVAWLPRFMERAALLGDRAGVE